MKNQLKKSFVWFAVIILLLNAAFMFNAGMVFGEERFSADYGGPATYAMTEVSREEISYARRELEDVKTTNKVPLYCSIPGLENSCGAIAGTIIVGFYDKYYEALIPNYTSYLPDGIYKGIDSIYVPEVMRKLYTLMRTNVDGPGVSRTDCLNGLKSYVQGQGRPIRITDIKVNGKINELLYYDAITKNNPSLLFCSRVDLYYFYAGETSETVTCQNLYNSGHVMVGYGMRTIKYYDENDNLFRTDKYLIVATGTSLLPDYYIKMDEAPQWCNGADIIRIT